MKAGRGYRGRDYAIEPDASAAVYPFCAAAISGGRARVEGLPADSIQADLKVLGVLEAMGCEVLRGADFSEVRGPVGRLRGVSVDMNEMPDAALAIAVVALFAGGPTQLAQHREPAHQGDRPPARARDRAAQARRRGHGDGGHASAIEPGRLRGAEIETYDDHRMAMSFALAGLRIPGVVDPRSRLRAKDLAGVLRDAGAAVGVTRFSATLRPLLRVYRGTS